VSRWGCRCCARPWDLPPARRLAEAATLAGAGYDARELLATVLLFAGEPAAALGVLDAAAGAPPARRITARATVAFWGLGRPDAAAELAAGRTGDAADRARLRAVEALMRLQLKQIDPARELADGVLADPRAAGPRISDVRRGGGGHRGPAVPRRPGPAGAGRRHAAGRRPGPL
jgi:hypothetical protein